MNIIFSEKFSYIMTKNDVTWMMYSYFSCELFYLCFLKTTYSHEPNMTTIIGEYFRVSNGIDDPFKWKMIYSISEIIIHSNDTYFSWVIFPNKSEKNYECMSGKDIFSRSIQTYFHGQIRKTLKWLIISSSLILFRKEHLFYNLLWTITFGIITTKVAILSHKTSNLFRDRFSMR